MKKNKSKNKNKKNDLENFRKILKQTSTSDFDGHSNFQKLTVKEKLIWLSELNYFKFIVKKKKS